MPLFNLAEHVLNAGLATPDRLALAVISPARADRWSHARLRATVLGAATGLRERGLLERSLITPQCGLGGLDEANAERVLDLLNGTVEAIRQRYRLGGLA